MNRDSYNKIAREWSDARRDFFGRERAYLNSVLEAAPAGAAILDLGCGTGRPMAEYAVYRGYCIIGVDQSESLLDLAKARLPQQHWILSPIETVEIGNGYAGAIIWDSLFHIQRSEHESILRKVVDGLPPGGRLMLTVGGSAHPPFSDVMFGQPFFYDSNTPAETEQILRGLGCRLVLAEFMNVPDGAADKGRYAIVAEKT
ncbi:class I SAM-dependent methyltransferase [Noviherbaspirillum autotrophicum]|uniref:Methyltransferase type 11 n=1 Tax=Noviherbaspirillum autotrophicum TaxID=709839 RepID=A0A0C2BF22_9BURK|nr:class I SAM-dependent methyltransferase [Noviherbaspirillum autotrophicum]KIF79830.1 methyltransferase type 11 [Noviherbaspirillum autotrophicum]